jgi:hypothetical protein
MCQLFHCLYIYIYIYIISFTLSLHLTLLSHQYIIDPPQIPGILTYLLLLLNHINFPFLIDWLNGQALVFIHPLPSPWGYSSGWALASWIISLHFFLFFICSDNEASNGRVKKWECGWKRSGPTYIADFHSFHLSEADCLIPEQFSFYGVRLLVSCPTPNLEDQGIPFRLAPTPWPVQHGCPYQ